MTLISFIREAIANDATRAEWSAADWLVYGQTEESVLVEGSYIDLGSFAHYLGVQATIVLWPMLKEKAVDSADPLRNMAVLIVDLLTTEGIDMGQSYNQATIDGLVGAIPEFTQEMADTLKAAGVQSKSRFEQAGLGRVLIGHVEKALAEVNK